MHQFICELLLYYHSLLSPTAGYTLPPPGFIWFFPGGGDDTMPSMTWHYHEPRRLTHIHTMPLPFDVSVATESGFVDLSVRLKLRNGLVYSGTSL